MRRWLALVLLAAASGCSTAPLAGFLDLVHPSHVGRGDAPEDPLRNAFPPPPPSGAQIQPPGPPISPPPASIGPPAASIGPPPAASDSGFAPRDAVPPPSPPERRPSRDIPPLTVPNT